MKLGDLSKEEIEEKSYSDLTKIILNEKGKKLKIVDIFKTICDAKGMSEAEFENRVADYFELVSTDKDIIVLEKGYCDLKIKHNQKVVISEDEEDEVVETEESQETDASDEPENEEEDIFYDNTSEDDDVTDDDELSDFVVVDEDEASM